MSRAPRSLRWPLLSVFGGVLLVGVGLVATRSGGSPTPDAVAATAAVSPVPTEDDANLAGDPELAAFVLAAKRAEQRNDPLLRCLTYPDWPGQAWPTGLAAAHCHYVFDPVPSLAEVAASLASGDLAGLDARYTELLDRHFATDSPSESIHQALARFDASADAGTVSAQWLELAPGSAWAHAARAAHLHAVAMQALASEDGTLSPERRMAAAAPVAAANEALAAAIALEPRLLPALAGVAELGLGLGDDAATDAAIAAAEAVDPACLAVARARLARLSPRHGGTVEAVHAHLAALREAHPERVLLALAAADVAIENGRAMLRHERFEEAQQALRPALVNSTAPEAFEDAAIAAARGVQRDHGAALALLLAGARYQPGRTAARELRGRLLMLAGERAWAMSVLQDVPDAPAVPLLARSGAARAAEPLAR